MIKPYQAPSDIFKVLAHPARLAIMAVLREGEQCVCHLEAMLELRQAYISQHLKILKNAEIVSDRRDGWNMFYRITQPEIFELIDLLFAIHGQPEGISFAHSQAECPCPKCHPDGNSIAAGKVILSPE